MNFNNIIKSRRSVRKYKTIKPDWRNIIEAIDAARFAPMAGGNYTLKFILVSDYDKIQKLAGCAQQEFIADAHYVVVVCSNPSRTINAYAERGKIYTRQQAGAAIENFWLKLIDKGLSTCWVGHFVESEIKKTLSIPEEIQVEAIFPIGYENKKPIRKKAKIDINSILYFEKYDNIQMKKIKKIET